jgi:hypothetical protein
MMKEWVLVTCFKIILQDMRVWTTKKHKNCRIKLRISWIWSKSVNNATTILGLCLKKLYLQLGDCWCCWCHQYLRIANWNCRRRNLIAKCMCSAPGQLPVTLFWKYYSRTWLVTLRKITETSEFTRRNLPHLAVAYPGFGGGSSPLVRGFTQFVNEWTPYSD